MSRLALLTLLGFMAFSCGSLPPPSDPDSPIDWPELLQCGPDVPDILSTVSTILLRGEHDGDPSIDLGPKAKAALEDLARKYGPSTVACLVDLLQREWTQPGASRSPETVAASVRASRFLEDVGTRVESNEAFEP